MRRSVMARPNLSVRSIQLSAFGVQSAQLFDSRAQPRGLSAIADCKERRHEQGAQAHWLVSPFQVLLAEHGRHRRFPLCPRFCSTSSRGLLQNLATPGRSIPKAEAVGNAFLLYSLVRGMLSRFAQPAADSS